MATSKIDGNRKTRAKTGGRQKGTRNKRTQELTELLEKRFPGYDPVSAMAAMANDTSLDETLRLSANKEVAKYVRPQLKAIEHSTQGGGMNIVWSTGVPDADENG
jgi:hypothetical protein